MKNSLLIGDLYGAAALLLTGASGWITGQVLRAGGGLSNLKTS